MKFATLFLQTDGKVKYEFAQIVRMLTGRVPTGIADANALLQDKQMFKARQLGEQEQQRLKGLTGELIPYFEFLGLLNEEIRRPGLATVLLLGAKFQAIVKRIGILLRAMKIGLKPDGCIHLLASKRVLTEDEVFAFHDLPNCPFEPGLEFAPSGGGIPVHDEAELLERTFTLAMRRNAALLQCNYRMVFCDSPSANTADTVGEWACRQPRQEGPIVVVSGPQPWGQYQSLSVANALKPFGAFDVSYIAYASQQPDIMAVVEAFAKTVFELTR